MKRFLLIINVIMTFSASAQEFPEAYYEPELLMVSQPKMEYYDASDNNYVLFYYDVKNIGSETYKGDFMILMEPDMDHYYAKSKIKVKAGAVKRIKMELDLGMIYYDSIYTVLPVYEFENQWYPLTAYEKFQSIMLCLNAPDYSSDLVVTTEPEPVTDYYFDVRLQRPPVYGYYYATPPVGCAYAYGYNTCCVQNNYIIINENGTSSSGGNVGTTSVSDRKSAPRVTHTHYSSSAASPTSSSRPSSTGSVQPTTTTTYRPSSSASSGVSSSSSRSSSSSVSNSSNSRASSSRATTSASQSSNRSSSTISNSSSSRSSSARSSSSGSSSSSSSRSSSSSSSASGSRAGGGRR